MSNYLITDNSHLKYHRGGLEIDEAHLQPIDGYSFVTDLEVLGMKSVGRIYFGQYGNLNYTTGEPVERPVIAGGENGVVDKYLRAGEQVYTKEQVISLINSRLYEKSDKMKPRLPEDVYGLLKELSENKAKNKPERAKDLMEKYEVINYEGD